jgi:hypothetical protein
MFQYISECTVACSETVRHHRNFRREGNLGNLFIRSCQKQNVFFPNYSVPPYKRFPYKGRILLSDILGRRRPVGFVRESYPIMGGTL